MKFYIILIFCFAFSINSFAQDLYLGYSFDPWGYEYYTELQDATLSTATGNDGAENINLPFNFPYMGVTYSTARISVNGWLELGQSYTGLGYDNDLASTTAKPLICPLWDDLIDDEISEIRYKSIGVAPARQFIVEWKDVLISGTRKSFQIRLFELDGTIAFHYGPQSTTGFLSASIGMNDHIGGPGHFISVSTGQFVTVDTMIANNNINSFDDIGENANFYFIPAGKAFYITTYQITDNVIKGAVNQPIIAILVTSRLGVLTMPSITSISLSTNGTTNTNDILNAKLFATGSSPYFSTTYQAGSTFNNPDGNFSINGGIGLGDYTTNYIWLTYDVSDSAQIGNVLDAECYQLSFNLTWPQSPDITAPSGSRTIVPGNGLAGTYTVGTSGDFTSLTSIVDSLAETFISAPITIEMLNDYNSTSETFPIEFPFIYGSSSQNKITIRPAITAADISIAGNGSAILKFSNCNNITIDGRPGGVGEQRHLTIQNEDSSGSSILVTGGSKNIDISYSKILGSSLSEVKGVVQSSYSGYNLYSDSISFRNCYIGKSNSSRPVNGFYFGPEMYAGSDHWRIVNSTISDFTDVGIKMESGYRILIENTEIYLTEPSNKNKVVGISLYPLTWNNQINRNRIHSLSSSNSVTNQIIGIEIPFASSHNIQNNFISLSGNEYSAVTGIDLNGEYGSTVNIFNNTIYIFGNSINEQNSYCFRRRATQYYAGFSFSLKNNILINKRHNVQGFGWHYAIGIEDIRGLNQMDYNNYYAVGTGTVLGRWLSYDVTSINEWRSFTQKDQHSISKNVNFISSTDLHLTGSSLGDVDLIAQPNSSVLVDIDNDPRSLYFPYMGADESIDYPLPVEFLSFTSSVVDNDVTLNWVTATETNNQGFQIEKRKTQEERSGNWQNIGFVNGNGTSTESRSYSFVDENLSSGKYQYRLKQIDFDGSYKYSSSIEVEVNIPEKFSLGQNFPNPFNPSTKIIWQSPVGSWQTLKIFDVLGNEVATLVNEYRNAGSYEINFDASKFSSGVYYYQLRAGDPSTGTGQGFVETKKMILMK
ncbi:MAG: right-handed parallel beta-helix repeat-containing protein [Ignavibacterium sp.]|nr:right-handed parallel beta-helix repeat-containing protein [Ignavibacterium sp.]